MSPSGFLASRSRLAESINNFGFVLYLASDFIDEVQNMERKLHLFSAAGLKCVTREIIILCLVENLPGLVFIAVCTGQGLVFDNEYPVEYSQALNES
ncbi:uncharacterized protein Bfra_006120 [Botrytis fragariae]|uniref:Uncharacterized protein n=1 Tax=Botrytis fragariae TaxID=1964551 RepID=A0A8H6ASD0_9HELO|nr:uncharacterized protein Bfra_006120 [Botrytis fragariae]KAF5872757.1 hypothetical protein Bfra_006120 [Botrytis fragariae]